MNPLRSGRITIAAAASFLFACESTPPTGPATAPPAAPEPIAAEAAAVAEPAKPVAAGTADSGTLGFVISQWYDALPEVEPAQCPGGMNLPESEHFEIDMEAFKAGVKELGYREAQEKFFPPDACSNPTAQKDPGFETFDGDVILAGLDLDGVDSKKGDGSKCAHDDFRGPNGESGIDSQHWRLLGCTKAYQPDGQIDRLYKGGNFIKEGYPMLIELEGVDDPKNDDDVKVRIYSGADPVTLGSSGEVLRDLSMPVHEEPKYWSEPAPGRIENGILTTDPVDLRLRFKQQVIDGEFYYRDARMRAELLPDGRLKGVLGFYWDADNFYTVNNDHKIGEYHSGRIAAETRGYMCAGIYNAIPKIADGHPDPETGECTSISAQMHFEGTPAFVIRQDS